MSDESEFKTPQELMDALDELARLENLLAILQDAKKKKEDNG